jgi:hypothetical protein
VLAVTFVSMMTIATWLSFGGLHLDTASRAVLMVKWAGAFMLFSMVMAFVFATLDEMRWDR